MRHRAEAVLHKPPRSGFSSNKPERVCKEMVVDMNCWLAVSEDFYRTVKPHSRFKLVHSKLFRIRNSFSRFEASIFTL